MLAYQGDAEDHGTMIAFNAPVTGGYLEERGIRLFVGGADELGSNDLWSTARVYLLKMSLHLSRAFPTSYSRILITQKEITLSSTVRRRFPT